MMELRGSGKKLSAGEGGASDFLSVLKYLVTAVFVTLSCVSPLKAEDLDDGPEAAFVYDISRSLIFLGGGALYGSVFLDAPLELQFSLSPYVTYFIKGEFTLTCPCIYGVATGLYTMSGGKRLRGWFVRNGILLYYFDPLFLPIGGGSGNSASVTIGIELTLGYQFIVSRDTLLSTGVGVRWGWMEGQFIIWPGIELLRIGFAW